VKLVNPSSSSISTYINVTAIKMIGPDVADFKLVNNQLGYIPIENSLPWPLAADTSIWIDIRFWPDPTKGYATRSMTLIAFGKDNGGKDYSYTLQCSGNVRHAILAVNQPSYDFCCQDPGSQCTAYHILTNP